MNSELASKFREFYTNRFGKINFYIEYYVFSNIYLKSIGLNKAQPNKSIGIKSLAYSLYNFLKVIFLLKHSDFSTIIILDDSTIDSNDKFIKYKDDNKTLKLTLNPNFRNYCTNNILNLFFIYRLCDLFAHFLTFFLKKQILFLKTRSFARKIIWFLFLKKFKCVKTIKLTDSYLKRELISESKKRGIVIHEYQHGLILPAHIGYFDFINCTNLNFSPDLIFSKKNKKYEPCSLSVKKLKEINSISNRLNIQLKFRNVKNMSTYCVEEKVNIILINQPSISKLCYSLYRTLSSMNVNVLIKNHPSQKNNLNFNYVSSIDDYTNQNVLYVGWYSTLLLELINLEQNVYLFKEPLNYFEGFISDYHYIDV